MKTKLTKTAAAAHCSKIAHKSKSMSRPPATQWEVDCKPVRVEKGALEIAMKSARGAFQREILEGYHFLSMSGVKYGGHCAESYQNVFARLKADVRLSVEEIRETYRNRRVLVIKLANDGWVLYGSVKVARSRSNDVTDLESKSIPKNLGKQRFYDAATCSCGNGGAR